jgi:hypothetical protein
MPQACLAHTDGYDTFFINMLILKNANKKSVLLKIYIAQNLYRFVVARSFLKNVAQNISSFRLNVWKILHHNIVFKNTLLRQFP